MTRITEAEFARIVDGVYEDRESIIRHNPIGTPEEILMWMVLACLTSYLNLTDQETPCFTGRPNAQMYREAILYILRDRRTDDFDAARHLAKLSDAG
jgi:hypothetical protein